MTHFDAIILGIVEGLTEFLPISSTGHLILASKILGLTTTDFLSAFEVIIQLGAILAVITVFWKKFLLDWTMNWKLVLALVPSVVVGATFYHAIKSLFASPLVVVVMLFVGGIAILCIENFLEKKGEGFVRREKVDDISFREAFFIGLFQVLAVIPGMSRAGATIMGGLLLGIRRKAVVEFSFLLAVPTMMAASVKDVYESSSVLTGENLSLLMVGFITAYIVALFGVKWFLRYVQTNTFRLFGWYRIVLAGIFFLFVL